MRRHIFFVLVIALFTAACTVPLGPGFFIERETLDARFVPEAPGSPPHLEISARFEISNAGNVPLDAVDIALPGSGYAHAHLRVEVAGRSVEPQGTTRADTPVVRVPIEPPLALNAKTVVTVTFALTQADAEIGGRIAADAVFLPPGAWTPRLLPPEKLFAKGGQRPKKFDFNVTVPAEFRVHAGGKAQGTRGGSAASRNRGALPPTEVAHRFLLRDDDPEPYLLAGTFSAASFSAHRATITFWTPEPMPPAAIEQSGKRLITAFTRFAELLGPLQKHESRFVFVAENASK
ncbi:MAG TPA: hypothetical protein VNL38_04160, partial [Candidatus Nitrosotenuis sp.]|nr:hypothetical protein [Candidatus Nitrosotenuis sp.]